MSASLVGFRSRLLGRFSTRWNRLRTSSRAPFGLGRFGRKRGAAFACGLTDRLAHGGAEDRVERRADAIGHGAVARDELGGGLGAAAIADAHPARQRQG